MKGFYKCAVSVKNLSWHPMVGSATVHFLGNYSGFKFYYCNDDFITVPIELTATVLDDATAVYLKNACGATMKRFCVSLSQAQAQAQVQLDEARLLRTAAGFTFTSTASSTTFGVGLASPQDLINITGLNAMAIAIKQSLSPSQSLRYQSTDDSVHTLTPDDVISLGDQTLAFVLAQYEWMWSLKTQVAAALNIDQINDILLANGLTSIFGPDQPNIPV